MKAESKYERRSAMLLPKYWFRQQRLRRALHDYPIYDPPHKAEERVLPDDKARENFQYFMDVRQERVRHFTSWLASKFDVEASLERKGIEDTLEWAADYIPIIMPSDDFWQTCLVFKTYAKPWSGEYTGANAFFDFGAMLGEAFIRHRPNLRWQMEWSLTDFPNVERAVPRETLTFLRNRERDIRARRKDECGGYRRPLLASVTDPVDYETPYGMITTDFGITCQAVSVEYAFKQRNAPKGLRVGRSKYLKNWIDLALTRSNSSQMALVKDRQNRSSHEHR